VTNLNTEHKSVALEDEFPHWIKGYLGNQHRWDELVEGQFPGAVLIKWGLNKRVYLLDGRIIKGSFVELGESGAERHSLRTEFEMNEVCEGKLWELHPDFQEKTGEWEMLMLDHLSGHTLNRLIEINQAGRVRLCSLMYALLYLSWKRLSYKQLRGRHIFIESDHTPIFIDFGGSEWCARWRAFWNNLSPIKKEKGKWQLSQFGYIAGCILRQSLRRSPTYSESGETAPSKRSFESNDETIVRLQLGKNREDLNREPVEGSLSACTLFRAWKQSVVDWAEVFPEQICDVFRWEFDEGAVIWGGDSWGVIWDEIRRKIEFQGKRVLEQGGSLGLGPVHARLAGAQSVVSFVESDASRRMGENAVSFFGVDQVRFEKPSGEKSAGFVKGDIGLALSIAANESNWGAVKETLSGCAMVIRRTRGGLEFINQA
jgi:hypothetical protein|tara:strand:- start:2037 stop:3323 length:1287 start_codon:yes stop_codon:yes gene_type:complete